MSQKLLTIGMAAYNNAHEVRETLMGLVMDHKKALAAGDIEIVVVDNYGCDTTQAVCDKLPIVRYIRATEIQGTAYPRDLLFRRSNTRFTCCIDSHIKIESDPPALLRLLDYLRANPDSRDILSGPLITEAQGIMWTEFRDIDQDGNEVWGAGMHGQGHARPFTGDEPFEIRAMGLGLFCARTEVFLGVGGFNPSFRGFGGEECYIHEKFRRAGGRALCLPWLRWWHAFRFQKEKPPFQALRLDMFKNYLHGRKELGIDARPVIQHYSHSVSITPQKMRAAIMEVYGGTDGEAVDRGGSGPGASGDGRGRPAGGGGSADASPAGGDAGVRSQQDEGACQCDGIGRDVVRPPDNPLPSLRGEVPVGLGAPGDIRGHASTGQPFVTAICLTYGRCPKWQHLIEETIESFLRQSYPADWRQLLILNDCPEQKLECLADGVRIVNARERFPSLGEKLNAAVAMAEEGIILAWDDDDINLRDRISQSVECIGTKDWWNPRATWYLAEVAGGPEGTGLHHDHHHGYCLNASAFTRDGWKRIGGFAAVGAVDRDIAARMDKVDCAYPLPPNRPDLWQYIYRWGVSPCHISGGGDCDRSYTMQGNKKVQAGTFVLKPHWRRDYQKLIEFQLEEISRHASAVHS